MACSLQHEQAEIPQRSIDQYVLRLEHQRRVSDRSIPPAIPTIQVPAGERIIVRSESEPPQAWSEGGREPDPVTEEKWH